MSSKLKIEDLKFPTGLFYSTQHLWARIEDKRIRVGMSDLGQKIAGKIVHVRIKKIGSSVKQGSLLGTAESIKWITGLTAPLTGELLEFNNQLREQPALINKDPYGNGWIAMLNPTDSERELKNLISSEKALREFIKNIT
ncbi:MAG: glycine cleavage system protein H [Candidatus Bathyarchaeia archaeon]